MTFCAQAMLIFSNEARRDAVLADAEAFIVGRPRWGTSSVQAVLSKLDEPAILLNLRFTIRTDQEALLARVQTFATGVRTPEPGSWFRLHDCAHDESDQPCAVASEVTW